MIDHCRNTKIASSSSRLSLKFSRFPALLTLCILTVALQSIPAVRADQFLCHECVEGVDPKCEDKFDNSSTTYQKDCNDRTGGWRPHVDPDEHREDFAYKDAKGCRKIIQEINDKLTIVRECAYSGEDVQGLKRIGNKGVRLFYYQCSTQLCNNAPATSFAKRTLFAAFFTAASFVCIFKLFTDA